MENYLTGDMPILLQNSNNEVFLQTIGDLEVDEKNKDYKAWGGYGWTKIDSVTKHKTNKKIYEMFAKNSCVKIAENSYLFNPSKKKSIKSIDYSFPDVASQELTHNDIQFFKEWDATHKTEFHQEYIYLQQKFFALKRCSYPSYRIELEKIGNNYRLLKKTNKVISDINCVQKIKEFKYKGDISVYSIKTECGHYQAGIGEIII